MFQDLASSTGATAQPRMSIWNEYTREIRTRRSASGSGRRRRNERSATCRRAFRNRGTANASGSTRPSPRWSSVLPFGLSRCSCGDRRWRRGASGGELARTTGVERPVRSNASLWKGLGFFSPWGVGLSLFLAYPVMSSVVYSFCDYSVLSPPRWVGLAELRRAAGRRGVLDRAEKHADLRGARAPARTLRGALVRAPARCQACAARASTARWFSCPR